MDHDKPQFRVGLRVKDVEAAGRFYSGLGFATTATIPGPDGQTVMAILGGNGVTLIADALHGLPFPDSARERRIQRGPRGLGVVAGLMVADLDQSYRWFLQADCEVTSEPRLEPWGARVFSALDPFGYEWEIMQPVLREDGDDATEATRKAWFEA